MKMSQLEQIIEVANTGSISQAAANLYISQPNISLSIKRVEDEIGAKLFHRTSSGMIPTLTGVEFVERAKDIMLQIDALGYFCRSDESILTQKLVVASAGLRILDTEIVNLIKKYKQTRMVFNHVTATGCQLLDCIAENKAELGFCAAYDFTKQLTLRQVATRKLEYHTIGKVPTGIYVGKNNPRFSDADTVVDFEKLKNVPIIKIVRREFNAPTLQEQLFTRLGIDLNPSHEILVDNFGTLRSTIVMLDAYAISTFVAHRPLYDYEAAYPDLRFIPFAPGIFESEIGYVQRENTIRSPLANELLNNIKRRFTI